MEVTTCRPDVEPKYYFKSPSSDLKCCGGRSHRSLRTICVKMYVTEVFRLCLCRSWRSASGSAGGSWYRSSSPSWSPWRWRSTSPRVKSCHITDGSCSSYSSSGLTQHCDGRTLLVMPGSAAQRTPKLIHAVMKTQRRERRRLLLLRPQTPKWQHTVIETHRRSNQSHLWILTKTSSPASSEVLITETLAHF